MIAAAGLLAECGELISEDMQDGMVLAGEMTVRDPLRGEDFGGLMINNDMLHLLASGWHY